MTNYTKAVNLITGAAAAFSLLACSHVGWEKDAANVTANVSPLASVVPTASPSFAENPYESNNAEEFQNSENSSYKPPLLLAPDQLKTLNDKGIFFPLEVENAIRNVNNWTTQEVREYELLCAEIQKTGECATDLECSCLCEVLDFECDGGY